MWAGGSAMRERGGGAKVEGGRVAAKEGGGDRDEEDEDELVPDVEAILRKSIAGGGAYKPYAVAMRDMHADFERHLRFVAGGLRGIARASRDEAAGKWDLLAEMLEFGIRD